jgi:hypothetical protein
MDWNGDVKLAGLHQMLQLMQNGTLKRSVFKFVGDPEWMAPEVLSQVYRKKWRKFYCSILFNRPPPSTTKLTFTALV